MNDTVVCENNEKIVYELNIKLVMLQFTVIGPIGSLPTPSTDLVWLTLIYL